MNIYDDKEMKQLLKETANPDKSVADKAMKDIIDGYLEATRNTNQFVKEARAGLIAKAAINDMTPVRRAIFREDILGNIFERQVLDAGAPARYPIDFVTEGDQDEYTAFSMPRHGYIPQRHVEGDEIYVPTFKVANAIDWDLDYAAEARWDVVGRALDVYRKGFIKRNNDDGWHTLLAAAFATGEMVNDPAAAAGFFTKELVSLMKVRQRRRTLNGQLTDLYVSPEALVDMRAWGVDEIDEITRREIFTSNDLNGLEPVVRIYGVNIRDMRELGNPGAVDQEYQDYFLSVLGGTLASGDSELVIGLDLANRDSFVMPVREDMTMFNDPDLHRQARAGVYGWERHGFAVLDNRRVLPGSF